MSTKLRQLNYTLFVAVAKYDWPRWTELSDILEELTMNMTDSYNDFSITKIVTKEKGRLNVKTNVKQHIGSLSVTVRHKDRHTNTYNNLNILIFKGSVRVASSVPLHVQEKLNNELNNEPLEKYLLDILQALAYWSAGSVQATEDSRIVNINAQTKGSEIMRFLQFSENISKTFSRTQIPFVHEHGSVATCHVYPVEGINASAKIQHTGVIQYMGFKEVDMLYVFSLLIDGEVNAWNGVKTIVNSCK
jgi:hypothetical protein